ncbi:hypothetical protein C8F04DRAFT_367231 [Mycena alexandri]|uniref:Pentatricopeptide repeat-containing protein n=1 Tax=Mycena alexandri TaxID=1745969 RepID=A0AAD6T3D6_9AGAR|nr:hypothetical protein C8F04DRAFT_367231 [Mycena alexandri]
MLRRVALAFKLENSISSQLASPAQCPFIPSLRSLTSVRYLATSRKRDQNRRVPPAETAPDIPKKSRPITPKWPHLSPRDHILKLYAQVPHAGARLKRIKDSPVLQAHFLDPENILYIIYTLASSSRPRTALFAINDSRKLGRELSIVAYEVAVYRLAAAKEWEHVLAVIRSAWHNLHETTPALLNWRARALLQTQHYTELYAIFQQFTANNFLPSRRTWHLVLSGYIRNHDLAGARECLREMEAAGFTPDHSTHALIATLYQHIGPDGQVKDRGIQSLPHIGTRQSTYMINSLMDLRLRIFDFNEVFYLLSAFDQSKIGPLTLMLAASRPVRDDNAINQGSLPGTVAPDAVTFTMFIDYFAHLHDLPRCLAILDHMRNAGVKPTLRTAASLIKAYFIAGQGGAATSMVAAMCDPKTTSRAMFEQVPSPEGHTPPFDVTQLGRPNRPVFNSFLRGVLDTHGLPGARNVLRLMRVNLLLPDSHSRRIIATHVHRVEHGSPRLIMHIMRSFSPRIALEEAHVVLAATMRYQKYLVDGIGWDRTAAKFSPVRRPSARPYPEADVSTVGPNFDPMAGIELPAHRRHRALFRPVQLSLAARGVKSDRATIALRIRHDAVIRNDMDSATEVFQTMVARGLHPNQYHYSALMEGFVKAGDFESAVDVMRAAARASYQPDVVMFTILIVGYAKHKNPEMALRIFRQMVAAGIQPDVPAIDAVSSAFFFVGAYDMCWQVLTSLWKHISPLPPDIDKTSLKSAAVYFRSLHRGREKGYPIKTTKEFRIALYREIALLSIIWKGRLHARTRAKWLLNHPEILQSGIQHQPRIGLWRGRVRWESRVGVRKRR